MKLFNKKLKGTSVLLFMLLAFLRTNAQQQMQFKVGDSTRTALAYFPKNATTIASPVIFAFHGHGGTALNFYNKCHFEKLWPEAIIIFPQGLNTPGSLTDPEGKKTGWQNQTGKMNDRDLEFFDVMLSDLHKKYKINDQQIYATGHSNGGGFAYLLDAERGAVFAAVAPSAAVAGIGKANLLKPKPVMHIMGENDPLVKPAFQRLTIASLKRVNKSESEGEKTGEFTTAYKSTIGNYPVVTYIFPGGHTYPMGVVEEIVKFFKTNAKP